MQLTEVSAKTGYIWYRQGLWLFRRNPLGFLTIFFTYMLAILAISMIPLIGGVLPFVLIPGAAVGFMAACRDTVAGKLVFPTVLVDGFRSYGTAAALRLLALGVAYLVAMTAVLAISGLADGGALFKIMTGMQELTPEMWNSEQMLWAELVAFACYVPVAMLFWFAPVLTTWHDVPAVKAMFFSFVTCWRNRGAFIVYGLLWFVTITFVSLTTSAILLAIGAPQYVLTIVFLASIVVLTMLYCSFYATYRGCYGVQEPGQTGASDAPGA